MFAVAPVLEAEEDAECRAGSSLPPDQPFSSKLTRRAVRFGTQQLGQGEPRHGGGFRQVPGCPSGFAKGAHPQHAADGPGLGRCCPAHVSMRTYRRIPFTTSNVSSLSSTMS